MWLHRRMSYDDVRYFIVQLGFVFFMFSHDHPVSWWSANRPHWTPMSHWDCCPLLFLPNCIISDARQQLHLQHSAVWREKWQLQEEMEWTQDIYRIRNNLIVLWCIWFHIFVMGWFDLPHCSPEIWKNFVLFGVAVKLCAASTRLFSCGLHLLILHL